MVSFTNKMYFPCFGKFCMFSSICVLLVMWMLYPYRTCGGQTGTIIVYIASLPIDSDLLILESGNKTIAIRPKFRNASDDRLRAIYVIKFREMRQHFKIAVSIRNSKTQSWNNISTTVCNLRREELLNKYHFFDHRIGLKIDWVNGAAPEVQTSIHVASGGTNELWENTSYLIPPQKLQADNNNNETRPESVALLRDLAG